MDQNGKQIVGLILGAVVGVLIMAIAWFLLQFLMVLFDASQGRVRVPIVFFFLPFVGAFYGWQLGPFVLDSNGRFASDVRKFWGRSPATRALIVAPVAWILLVLVFIAIFEPEPFYNGLLRMSESRLILLSKILIFPPISGIAIYMAIMAVKGKK